jgi:hypothetical protein
MLLQHVCETHETSIIKHLQLVTLNHLLQYKTETLETFGKTLFQHMQHSNKKMIATYDCKNKRNILNKRLQHASENTRI